MFAGQAVQAWYCNGYFMRKAGKAKLPTIHYILKFNVSTWLADRCYTSLGKIRAE
jgi:hypothetical protein